ncbi:MAG: helix-turn-helix transcriptional regulator [Sphaerochaetaceae bacterium]|nr:helix-turn-helix transcriptional regulator [Sphaerochaetaceae bacterium]
MDYKTLKNKYLSDENIKAKYDELEPEYQLIKEIISLREEQHISQQELADKTGIDRSDISKLEHGTANPSLKTIKRIAEGLGKKVYIQFV